jgi:hypothetical protein
MENSKNSNRNLESDSNANLETVSIVIPKNNKKIEDKYQKCDGIPSILNTIYLQIGIPFIVLLVIVCLFLFLFLSIDYVYLSLFLIICIYATSIILPILLTYSHVNSIKEKCFNYGKDIGSNIPIATPIDNI